MANGRVQRRLAAIMAADVVGYSRLMASHEETTLADLNAHLNELIKPGIAEYGGRIVKTTGDGLLAEFGSIVDAVHCAIGIQQGMPGRNHDRPADRRIELRIGINIGDIIVEGDDIFGDGVNIAARLEGSADPGAVLISDAVMRQTEGKIAAPFEDLGELDLKNIDQPVRAWQWHAGGTGRQPEQSTATRATQRKSSIAVLPFDNLSADPDQDYFADGMVEDIITALSRFNQLFVVARNSTFAYKGRSVDIRAVATDLGVKYVLEGSVRKAGDRVRIVCQLIDGETGGHIWADRFNGRMEDIFDLQDEMTATIVGLIEPAIRKADLEQALRKPPSNLNAYDLYLQALPFAYRLRLEDSKKAYELLESAIDLDPDYAPTLALSAWCLEQGITRDWPPLTADDRALCIARANAALSTDGNDAIAIVLAGFALQMVDTEFQNGDSVADRALALNPNSAIVLSFSGLTFMFNGNTNRAEACFKKGTTLNPTDMGNLVNLFGLAMVSFARGDYDGVRDLGLRSASLNPNRDSIYWVLTAALGHLGLADEAERIVAKLRSLNPKASLSHYSEALPFRDAKVKAALLEGMRLAGLPESFEAGPDRQPAR